jgi:cytochrome c553
VLVDGGVAAAHASGVRDMRRLVRFGVPTLAAVALASGASVRGQGAPPAWAYVVNPPDFRPPPDDGRLRHVPDSTAAFTLTQVRDLFVAPDWHPGDHPPMPQVVARGRKPGVFACGFCHRADGPGGPENTSLGGLPAAYIVQQMADFRSGARATSVPERDPPKLMIALSRDATDAEVAAAAAYFSTLEPRSNLSVVETATVPRTFVAGWHLAAAKSADTEPLGQRIVEVPEDLERFESRDARVRFIAYAPPGSIEKGRALAATGGGGRTVQCGICHGPGLKGLGPVPGIAGRSPSYIVRQLFDFKHGARAGARSALMAPTVDEMTLDDMISLAAYAASLKP